MLRYMCLLAAVWAADSALAPFITPCTETDTACVIANAQKAIPIMAAGIPALGVKTLDPMHIDTIKSDQSGLNLLFKDSTVTGLKDCVAEGYKHDPARGRQQYIQRCSVKLSGRYTVSGRLFILPVQGDGDYTINIRDIVIKTTTEVSVVKGDDGKDHWQVTNWKHSYLTKTGAKFDFKNLFNGNKVLAGPVEQFLNSNWREVMQEVAPPIVKAVVSNVVDAIKALFKAVPKDELVLP